MEKLSSSSFFKVEYTQEFAILGVTNTDNYIKKCILHIYLAAKDC